MLLGSLLSVFVGEERCLVLVRATISVAKVVQVVDKLGLDFCYLLVCELLYVLVEPACGRLEGVGNSCVPAHGDDLVNAPLAVGPAKVLRGEQERVETLHCLCRVQHEVLVPHVIGWHLRTVLPNDRVELVPSSGLLQAKPGPPVRILLMRGVLGLPRVREGVDSRGL